MTKDMSQNIYSQANHCRYQEQTNFQSVNQSKKKLLSLSYYEVWYFKFNRIEEQDTFWFRYTILKSPNHEPKFEIWGIYHNFRTGQRFAKKEMTQFKQLPPFQTETSGAAKGQIQQALTWSFHFQQAQLPKPLSPFFHVPNIFQKLRLAKSTVCKPYLDILFSGQLTIGNQNFDITNARGCQGHIWGTKYAHSWAWAHCNLWSTHSENPSNHNPNAEIKPNNVVLEMLSARIQVAGIFTSPALSALFFHEDGQSYEFNSLKESIAIRTKYAIETWHIEAENDDVRLNIEVSTKREHMNGVTYQTTDDRVLYCHNTAFANARITVFDRKRSTTRTYQSLHTTSFEVVSETKDPLVEFVL